MSSLTALVVLGLAAVLRTMLPILRARRNPLSKVLAFEFGVRPTGPAGTWTSRDRAFSGLLSLLTAACCIGLGILIAQIAQPFKDDTAANYFVTGIVVVLWFLALMAIVNAMTALARAPFTRTPHEGAPLPQGANRLLSNLRAALQHPAAFLALFLLLTGLAILIAYLLIGGQ